MGLLYHYTTLSGFLGIIDSKKMFATDSLFLNDESEVFYTINIARRIANDRLMAQKNALTNEYMAKKSLVVLLERIEDHLHSVSNHVCSFTEKGDQLSQWRGYGKGGGVSFSFDEDDLNFFCSEHSYGLLSCVYNIKEQKEHLEGLMDRYVVDYLKTIDSDESNADKLLLFTKNLMDVAIKYKDNSFHEEVESRIICGNKKSMDLGISYRVNNSLIVPHVELPILGDDGIKIKKIVIGPNQSKELIKLSIEKLLKQKNIEFDEVLFSNIPYRG